MTAPIRQVIRANEEDGLVASIISCWEVAKLVERGRLQLSIPVEQWIEQALAFPSVELVELTPRIAVESTQLPGEFHRDPADQMIVATARVYDIAHLTTDSFVHALTSGLSGRPGREVLSSSRAWQ